VNAKARATAERAICVRQFLLPTVLERLDDSKTASADRAIGPIATEHLLRRA
jgi:hypothetical protein